MKNIRFLALTLTVLLHGISLSSAEVRIVDASHYSGVFGENRNYRIFLPSGYEQDTAKRYPVIYFFHGWSQRYFGVTQGRGAYEKGGDNGGDNIASFVEGHDVIVVKWDGFNPRDGEQYNLRPYNIGPVETYRQFPMYFPELVTHIDSHYRTVPDRTHRAVSGLSMGGFMTFWIGGKYPDLVCAAGNFCGSPEFFTGPRVFPVEYRHLDMYNNYGGMRIRLNYGDKDFIRSYHEDMNRVFPYVIDNYEFSVYDAAHSTCGLGEMFSFIIDTFDNPPQKPERWHHIDVYPAFSVWDYNVSSDRTEPGFNILENVNRRGLRNTVRKFLPDGPSLAHVLTTITTAPLYDPNTVYSITDIDLENGDAQQYDLISDNSGCLPFTLDGHPHEIGISDTGNRPEITIASFDIANMPWAVRGKEIELTITALNKGNADSGRITATVTANNPVATVHKSETAFGGMAAGKRRQASSPVSFSVEKENVDAVSLHVTFSGPGGLQWKDDIVVTIRPDAAVFKEILIADGKEFTVAKAGTTHVSIFLGNGNGDGRANPGESIVVLVKDKVNNVLRRLGLHSSDSYADPGGMKRRISDYWGRYDHVGGSEKPSELLIASDCPEGHVIDCFADYWLPDYPEHHIVSGTVQIPVTGRDKTAPEIEWAKVSAGNLLQVRMRDGGKIATVSASFIYQKTNFTSNKHENFQVMLRDDGSRGDRVAGDNVFSALIPEREFGLYTVEIAAQDAEGNSSGKSFENLVTIK